MTESFTPAGQEPQQPDTALSKGRRTTAVRLALLCLAVTLAFIAARPAWAAFVLDYFTARTVQGDLLLEWETSSEYNINGFEIYCKEESLPDDQYHLIGTRPSVGSIDSGAGYNFLVTSGLEPGMTYCFRLQEISADGSPPDYRDICGYGIDISPETASLETPEATPLAGIAASPTLAQVALPTAVVGQGTPITIDALPTDALTPGAAPTSTFTPAPPTTATPLALATATSPNQPNSPLMTSPGQPSSPFSTPTWTPPATPVPGMSNDAFNSPAATPTWTPMPTATWTPAGATPLAPAPTASALAAGESQANTGADGGTGQTVDAGAVTTPAYIVVTSTPTPANQTPEATFTPLPTATSLPVTEAGLFSLANPSVENLILLTLCFIFLGAGGIGALGLIATVLYVRSRQTSRWPEDKGDDYHLLDELDRRDDWFG